MRLPRKRFWKICAISFILTYFSIVLVLMASKFTHRENSYDHNDIRHSLNIFYTTVHLDLKGSPPKLEYLNSLLPSLKELGVNSLLMEYEDMFPYDGRLVNLSAENSYKPHKLKSFLTNATTLGFEIIPLIQTFGHMEFALKLEEFKHLREDPRYPDCLCPTRRKSLDLIRDMLIQVMNFHNKIARLKFVHIGCDEVYSMNMCDDCQSRKLKKISIFLSYVDSVKNIVDTLSPNTSVLIWDDMLRKHISPGKLLLLKDDLNVTPVYWSYHHTLNIPLAKIYEYSKKFGHIWMASAFKGADGREALFPKLEQRYLNHYEWMRLYQNFSSSKISNSFEGIIVTGWSRYEHFAPPCELLPIGWPSLVLNLLFVKKLRSTTLSTLKIDPDNFYEKYLKRDFKNFLNCRYPVELNGLNLANCAFNESELWNHMLYLDNLTMVVQHFVKNKVALDSYDLYEDFLPKRTIEHYRKYRDYLENELIRICKMLFLDMKNFFDDDVTEVYIKQLSYSSKKALSAVKSIMTHASRLETWDRKSFNISYRGKMKVKTTHWMET